MTNLEKRVKAIEEALANLGLKKEYIDEKCNSCHGSGTIKFKLGPNFTQEEDCNKCNKTGKTKTRPVWRKK